MPGKRVARKLPAWMTQKVCDQSSESNERKSLQPFYFQGAIKYCHTVGDMGLACEMLISQADREDELILGFDVEWPVDYRRGSGKIALIQVCCDETVCYLFHVSLMSSLPKIFVNLIKHSKVRLVGNCIKNDIWKFGKDFDIPVAKLIGSPQVVDLGEFANKVLNCSQTWSLDRLALHLMSVTIDKADSIRKSRWDLELSTDQQLYAATDAYISLTIFNKLRAKENSTT